MIDVSNWSYFECVKLFECVNTGNVLARDIIDGSGTTPYVTASSYNNGVVAYIDSSKYDIIKGNCILVGGKTFTITYQKDDFISNDSHNFIIRVKDYTISDLAYLYMVPVIYNYFGQKYSWNDAVTKKRFLSEKIPLPSTSTGQPNWAYMESYMKQMIEGSERKLENLRNANYKKQPIDTQNWGTFRIEDLFDLSLPKGDLQIKKVEDGDIPLITPSNFNNGVLKHISANSNSTKYTSNSLTVDMFGNAYYQVKNFFVTAHGHVNVLIPKFEINEYNGTFIATAIRAMFLDKYGFSEMCTLKVLKAESIKLPITSNGNPNWQYMEEYMKSFMDISEKTISILQSNI